ncbi:hypothetical protein E2P81_ATG09518 [Venturia nashicola]|nr:hypothetical protein E2P81_ATG09518 [Venturia nashicola]
MSDMNLQAESSTSDNTSAAFIAIGDSQMQSNVRLQDVGVTQEAINQSRLDTDMLYDIDTICVKNTDTLVSWATPEFQ